jgi:glyoxylase-like metal-dependent hydrolase (beta-lactamase superfamily II)
MSLWFACSLAHGQAADTKWTEQMQDVDEHVTSLGHGLYVLSPNIRPLAGNVTVATGSDGVIVIDTQFAPLYPKLRASIAALSKQPVKFVIDTHHHGDHTGGNPSFAHDGAILVAQDNAAIHLASPPNNLDGTPVKPMAKEGMPALTFDNAMTVSVAGQVARLVHTAQPAHTDDDLFVVFADANVIVTGDIYNALLYPNIDSRVGGSIDGIIASVDQILGLTNDQTLIVPGHGAVTHRDGLVEYRQMLVTARDRIAKAKAAGMSEQQVNDAHLLDDLNARWYLPGSPVAKTFPALVYHSLKSGN